jgi:hypothetical protein
MPPLNGTPRPPARSINPQRQAAPGYRRDGNPSVPKKNNFKGARGNAVPGTMMSDARRRSHAFANELAKTGLSPLVRMHKLAMWQEQEWARSVALLDAARDTGKAKLIAGARTDAKEWGQEVRSTLSEMLVFCHPRLSAVYTKIASEPTSRVISGKPGESLEQALLRQSRTESDALIEQHDKQADGPPTTIFLEESDGI